jgi:hypothetical protein
MRRTTTTSVRIDACDLATVLRALLDAGTLRLDVPIGHRAHLNASRGIANAVAAYARSVPTSTRIADYAEAWTWLAEHSCVGQRELSEAARTDGGVFTLAAFAAPPPTAIADIVARVDKKRADLLSLDDNEAPGLNSEPSKGTPQHEA